MTTENDIELEQNQIDILQLALADSNEPEINPSMLSDFMDDDIEPIAGAESAPLSLESESPDEDHGLLSSLEFDDESDHDTEADLTDLAEDPEEDKELISEADLEEELALVDDKAEVAPIRAALGESIVEHENGPQHENAEQVVMTGAGLMGSLALITRGLKRSLSAGPEKHVKSFSNELRAMDGFLDSAAGHATALRGSILGRLSDAQAGELDSTLLKEAYSVQSVKDSRNALLKSSEQFEESITRLIKIGAKAGLDRGDIQREIDSKVEDFEQNVVDKVGDLQNEDGSPLKRSLKKILERITALVLVFLATLRGEQKAAMSM